MGVSVVFEDGSDAVEVVPGEEAVCVLRVENTGMVVDRVLLDVLGDAAGWAQVEPAHANLLPGATERVRITFRPPRTASQAPGEVRFGLRAMSTEDPDGSCIEEGSVRVAEFGDLGAQLVPRNSTGRRSARFKLVVENRGNRPEQIRVETLDPEARLTFRTRPAVFVARPGTATFVRLRTVPRKTFFKGPNRTLPFEVTAVPERGEAAKAEAVMLEKQTLPEWLLPVLGIAVVACGLLFALWIAVLKPVHSAATEAAKAKDAAGAAQSAASMAGAMATAKANPSPGPPTALAVKLDSSTVVAGGTERAVASGTFAGSAGAMPKLVWTSSAPDIATVAPDGVVTALSPGAATITATAATATASPAAPAPDPAVSSTPASPEVVAGSVRVTVVGPVSVSTTTLPAAAVGKAYSQALSGAGGTGSYTWSVSSGTLPPGLSLAPDSGVISGTPTAAAKASLTLHLADAGTPGLFANRTLELTVVNAVGVESTALPGATTGAAYSQTLTGIHGTAPYRWSLAQGALPDGLSLDPASGTVSGTPTSAGTFDLTVLVTDSAKPGQTATQHLSLTVAKPLLITTLTVPDAVSSTPYSQTLNALGGTGPYTWSVSSGTLPPGLTLGPTSGVISGTPQLEGSFAFTVLATDAEKPEHTASRAFTVQVVTGFAITTSSLPQAAIGTPYDTTLTALGGAKLRVWTLMGTLPPGLTFKDGEISGTPTTAGSFPFAVRATDSSAPPLTANQSLTITVAASLQITTGSLPKAVTGQKYAATLTATGGTAPYTWSIVGSLPHGLSLNPATGVIGGTPDAVTTDPATFDIAVADTGPPVQHVTLHDAAIAVIHPLTFQRPAPPVAQLGREYGDVTPTRSGGSGKYHWSVTSGALPDGLSVDEGKGTIIGTPSSRASTGKYDFTLTLQDATDPTLFTSDSFSLVVVNPLSVSSAYRWSGTVGTRFQEKIQPTGGAGQYIFAMDDPPDGLLFDPSAGELSGMPDAPCRKQQSGGAHVVVPCDAYAQDRDVTITDALGETIRTTVHVAVTVPPLVVDFTANVPAQTAGSALSFDATTTAPTGGYGSGTYVYSVDKCPTSAPCIDASTGKVTINGLDGQAKTFTVKVTSKDPANDQNTVVAEHPVTIEAVPTPTATSTTPSGGHS